MVASPCHYGLMLEVVVVPHLVILAQIWEYTDQQETFLLDSTAYQRNSRIVSDRLWKCMPRLLVCSSHILAPIPGSNKTHVVRGKWRGL